MPTKKRVYAYYDGSNFYHHLKENYGIININFLDMTNEMVDQANEEIKKIRYFNSPINQQEDPVKYAKQQQFFQELRKIPIMELSFGKLVKRNLKKININCPSCNHQQSNTLKCPACNRDINVNNCFKYTEKGVDVKLAITLIVDALMDKFDTALIFSSDADYVAAINYVVKKVGKDVIYCHLPRPNTNELRQVCTNHRLITKQNVENAQLP